MSSEKRQRPFRILSLDGGGVRAIIQAVILGRVIKRYPKFLDEVDLFTGTSAGAIVASALCAGISPDETVVFYEEEVSKIFSEGFMKRIASINNAIGAAYSSDALKDKLTKEFGNKKLSELSHKLLIPTFRLDADDVHSPNREPNQPPKPSCRWTPVFLHNLPNSKTSDTPVVDAILRTTAAPTYFPIYQGYVDGGVVANNPALCAYSTIMSNETMINEGVRDVVIMSISTGSNPKGVHDYGSGNWGLFEWGTKIVDLLLDSSTESIDYQCRCLLKEKYFRLDPFLPKDIPLDDAASLPILKDVASKVDLSGLEQWVEQFWQSDEKINTDVPIEEFKEEDYIDKNAAVNNGSWRCVIQ